MKIEPETVGAVHTHTPSIQLINGDCYEKLKEIPSGSVDLVVIDPPYEVTNTGGGFFIKNLIINSSKEGDTVLDCFMRKRYNRSCL